MSDSYTTLRAANIARDKLWFKDVAAPPLWRACELAGELGELFEARGSGNITLEAADVLVCTDLALMELGAPEFPPRPTHGMPTYQRYVAMGQSPSGALVAGIVQTGLLYCNLAKKLYREALGMPGTRTTPEAAGAHLYDVALGVQALLYHYSIDPELAVRAKFNQTSQKVGFDVFIGEPPPNLLRPSPGTFEERRILAERNKRLADEQRKATTLHAEQQKGA